MENKIGGYLNLNESFKEIFDSDLINLNEGVGLYLQRKFNQLVQRLRDENIACSVIMDFGAITVEVGYDGIDDKKTIFKINQIARKLDLEFPTFSITAQTTTSRAAKKEVIEPLKAGFNKAYHATFDNKDYSQPKRPTRPSRPSRPMGNPRSNNSNFSAHKSAFDAL